jgi:hypothetical protein
VKNDAYQQAKACFIAGHFEKPEKILVQLLQVLVYWRGSAQSFFAYATLI